MRDRRLTLKLTVCLVALLAHRAPATVHYVDSNSTNAVPPFTNWITAAVTIQNAVDVADSGDEILVTNGVYRTGGRVISPYLLTNRVVVDKAVTVRSVNGPAATLIQGNPTNGNSAVRCLYLASGAFLSGFTLTNGGTRTLGDTSKERSGAGVWCESASAVVSNCTLAGNVASRSGGGASGGMLIDCALTGNQASGTVAGVGGGGGYSSTLVHCILSGNSATTAGGAANACVLTNCLVSSNSAVRGGGTYSSTLANCTLTGNSASNDGGGANGGTLDGCAIAGNAATYGGGASAGILRQCTLIGNSALVLGGGSCSNSLNNCIAFYNTAPTDPNYAAATLNFCCSTPLPADGLNNISADPQLADTSHLAAISPCRGGGQGAAALGVDIDGEPWADPPSIGCDEFYSGSVTGALSVAILPGFTNVIPGFEIGFAAQIAGHAGASRWEFGDGTVVSNRPNASHSWAVPGDYHVLLWAYNQNNPDGVGAAVTIHVVGQPVHYVAAGSTNPVAPYVSWATAAKNIQDAVDATSVAGALVWVSNGVYQTGGRVVSPGQVTNRVAVTRPVTIQSANGPALTVIRGNPTNGNSAVRCVYLTNGATLAGFTLTGGGTRSAGDIYRDRSGAGAWCASSSVVLSNCVLAGNAANFHGGGAYFGQLETCILSNNSAYYGGGSDSSALIDCSVSGNSANWGGGAFGGTLAHCTLTANSAGADGGAANSAALDDCVLNGNSAVYGGGVESCTLNASTLTGNVASADGGAADNSTLVHCTLNANSATNSGGGASEGTLDNCVVTSNMAADGGGASGSLLTDSTLRGNWAGNRGGAASSSLLQRCTLSSNSATNYGGGAYGSTLDHCTLTSNSAVNGGGTYKGSLAQCVVTGNSAVAGGGTYLGGVNSSLLATNTATQSGGGSYSSTLNNCVLTGNSAALSGGGNSGGALDNCTLVGNSAGVSGGGVASATLTNCIVVDNSAPAGANYADSVMDYSCTTPLPADGVGNITNAPLFLDEAAGNYHIAGTSPCVDTGTDLSAIFTNDFDGNLRPVDGNCDLVAQFDMGAIEFQPRTLLVWQESTNPVIPYATWDTAAHTIQDAVDAANVGDRVLVMNGVYATGGRTVPPWLLTNRVVVDKSLVVQSVNGPAVTAIRGYQVPNTTNGDSAVRCVYLTNSAALVGFALTNGATRGSGDRTNELSGGAVWCASTNSTVQNCVLAGNSASGDAGGAHRGTLSNCTLTGNSAYRGGGAGGCLLYASMFSSNAALYEGGAAHSSRLNDCTLTANLAGHGGGGVVSCILSNCVLTGNRCNPGLGGGALSSKLTDCLLSSNWAATYGGGTSGGSLVNCRLNGNSAPYGGAVDTGTASNCVMNSNSAYSGGAAFFGTLWNCTLCANSATNDGGGTSSGFVYNSILYYNTAPSGSNYYHGALQYCCTLPFFTGTKGNITNEPIFVDYAGGNLRLQPNSPCINAGTNFYAPAGPDLDGNPRIVGGTVDIGAYECQSPALLDFYTWLQGYGLSTYSGDVYADGDSDGMNNWQEWRSGTDPTNAMSLLQLLMPTGDFSGLTLTWESVTNRTYFIERGTNLSAPPSFSLLATNLAGQSGTTSYTDTNAVGSSAFYYRVGVQ